MDCNNFEGCEERLASNNGKDASIFTKVVQANIVIHGEVEHSSYSSFQNCINRNDQNLQSLNKEDPSTFEAVQIQQVLYASDSMNRSTLMFSCVVLCNSTFYSILVNHMKACRICRKQHACFTS